MRHLLIFVGVITGLYAIVSSYDNRYDLTTVFASISLLSFIGAAQFDPDKKLEDILENLDEEPNLQPVVQKQQKKSNALPPPSKRNIKFFNRYFSIEYVSIPQQISGA